MPFSPLAIPPASSSAELARLSKRVGDTQLGLEAIIDTLVAAKAFSVEQYEAALHRRRFEHVRLGGTCCFRHNIQDVISAPELAALIGSYLDGRVAKTLRATSPSACIMAKSAARNPGTPLLFVEGLGSHGGLVDPEVGVWQPLPPACEKRVGAAVAVLNDSVFAFGGFNNSTERFLKIADWYDHKTRKWEPLPSMSERRSRASAVVLAGHVYVCGGFAGQQNLSSVERLSLTNAVWEPVPSLSGGRTSAAIVREMGTSSNGCFWICGGSTGQRAVRTAERFDPERGVWQTMPRMLERRAGPSAVAVQGTVIVCGGNNGMVLLNSAERYDPTSGAWHALSVMPRKLRARVATAACVANHVWILGGYDSDDGFGPPMLFDSELGQWTQQAPLVQTSRLTYE